MRISPHPVPHDTAHAGHRPARLAKRTPRIPCAQTVQARPGGDQAPEIADLKFPLVLRRPCAHMWPATLPLSTTCFLRRLSIRFCTDEPGCHILWAVII